MCLEGLEVEDLNIRKPEALQDVQVDGSQAVVRLLSLDGVKSEHEIGGDEEDRKENEISNMKSGRNDAIQDAEAKSTEPQKVGDVHIPWNMV